MASLGRTQLPLEKYVSVEKHFLIGLAQAYAGKRLAPAEVAAKLRWSRKYNKDGTQATASHLNHVMGVCRRCCEKHMTGKKIPPSILKVTQLAVHAHVQT